jgi:hypothetical protein
MSHRLATELRLLYKCEAEHKLPAAPIVRQLIAWEQWAMPDVVPPVPQWVVFEWPRGGAVNYEMEWRGFASKLASDSKPTWSDSKGGDS